MPTPFGVTVETPQSAPSPAMPPPDNTQQGQSTGRAASTGPKSFIRIRWKGHTIHDLDALREEAHRLETESNVDDAGKKFHELLDISTHLLPAASDESAGFAYEAACFFARNDDMENADLLLDGLSGDFVQRWGPAHERTLKHLGMVSKLLAQWDRHDDALNILKRLTGDFSTSLLDSHQEQASQAHTPRSIVSRTYLNVISPSVQDSIKIIQNASKSTSRSSSLAILSAQIDIDRAVDLDDDNSPDRVITGLLQVMEKDLEKNAADIVLGKCLLVKFYAKAGMTEESMEALTTAKDSVLSICRAQCRLPIAFFNSSVDLAKIILDFKQENEANNLLERLQEKSADVYGEDHTDTISLLIRVGKMFERIKRWDLARSRFEAAYAAVVTQLGIESLLAKKLEESLENESYSFDVEQDVDSSFFPAIVL
jgi:hypothetical protein